MKLLMMMMLWSTGSQPQLASYPITNDSCNTWSQYRSNFNNLNQRLTTAQTVWNGHWPPAGQTHRGEVTSLNHALHHHADSTSSLNHCVNAQAGFTTRHRKPTSLKREQTVVDSYCVARFRDSATKTTRLGELLRATNNY